MQEKADSYHLEEILLFVKSEVANRIITMPKKNGDGTEDVKQMVSVISQLRNIVRFDKV